MKGAIAVSMITVDLRSRTPIYEQLVENIKRLITDGLMLPDEQLPAVRKLAGELAINPNTIQKAYNLLESVGVVYSLPGRGSFVASNTETLSELERASLMGRFRQNAGEARRLGIGFDELESVIREAYDTPLRNVSANRPGSATPTTEF